MIAKAPGIGQAKAERSPGGKPPSGLRECDDAYRGCCWLHLAGAAHAPYRPVFSTVCKGGGGAGGRGGGGEGPSKNGFQSHLIS